MTGARAGAVWAALALLLSLPILLHPAVPAVDLPNHMARQFIGTAGSAALDRFYAFAFAFRFNSTADAAWYFVAHRFLSVEAFTRVAAVFFVAGLPGATLIVGRVARGSWSLWPLLSAFVVYGDCFFVGFQNYATALPFALLALALWLATEARPPWQRALAALVPALAVFQMHLLAFSVLALGAFGREVHRLLLAGRDAPSHALRNLPLALPFVVVGLVHRALKGAQPANTFGSDWDYGALADHLAVVPSAFRILVAEDDPATRSLGAVLPVLLLLLVAAVPAAGRRAGLSVHPALVGPALALALFSLVVPTRVDGVSFVQLRYPLLAIALCFAGFEWRPATPALGWGVGAGVAALGALRLWQVERVFARYDQEIEDLGEVLRSVGPGDRVLPVTPGPQFSEPRLWHVQAYAVFRREAFVPTLFQGVNSLEVRPEWREWATPAQFPVVNADIVFRGAHPEFQDPTYNGYNFWLDWRRKFTHVLAFGPLPDELLAETGLVLEGERGRFRIYRVP